MFFDIASEQAVTPLVFIWPAAATLVIIILCIVIVVILLYLVSNVVQKIGETIIPVASHPIDILYTIYSLYLGPSPFNPSP